jgi:two-component system chemotaxis response regulator CheB
VGSCELIVVGCSWGGLAAIGCILGSVPSDLGAALVIAQHRGPARSPMASMLGRNTAWKVAEAEDKEPIVPGRVYLAPAAYHLLVDQGRLALSTDAPVRYSRPSIDVLFESAADAYGPGVLGVVLTGANDDGAAGAVRIVERGGTVVVQDPETAERPAMPLAVLATGIEATVLPLEQIGPFLGTVCRAPVADAEEAAQ